jgi:hypothetical protein
MPMSALFECRTLRQLSTHVDDLRHEYLLDMIASGCSEVEALLERVAAIPQSKARDLVLELRGEGTR